MSNERLDFLIWTLIYSGLIFVCLGLFLRRGEEILGWVFVAAGAVDALAGVLLLWRRSLRPD